MAKDIKLNIKNAQIAQALKKFNKKSLAPIKKPKKATKKASKKEKDAPLKAETYKRKARILPAEEKAPKIPVKKPEKKEIEPIKEVIESKEETAIKEEKKIEQPVTEKAAAIETKEKPKVEEKPIQKKGSPPIKAIEKDIKKPFKTAVDFKAAKRPEKYRSFDARDRQGLRAQEEGRWRRRRSYRYKKPISTIPIVRPKNLKVRLPITIKELAQAMKLKASELIRKLFLQCIILTLNDFLDDETTIQLLGQEFACEIEIDLAEEKRLKITEESIKEEIAKCPKDSLISRPPVIAFMGHVDHGKTSLIDAIRSSNITSSEAGQITQHIGAFHTKTKFGYITILDTPGHEAFSEMRSRGACVTDIVILVVAGDEGMKAQTIEAMNQAKEAKVQIIVAINKSDKPGFDTDKVYRQLADHELLPEAWGGTTITINCSAQTKDGIDELLEMISLQSEILELRANPSARARGSILESEMHKGLGAVATALIQNGTLKTGNAIVFADRWGRIKTIHDQYNNLINEAGPSIPVKITGLSDLAEAGCEFVVVADEKEAKDLAEARKQKIQQTSLKQRKTFSLENLAEKEKKIFHVILRADMQGSLEALQSSLLNIKTDKVDLRIVSSEVGEISESDVRLAYASKAIILGFHTKVESHAEHQIKQLKVTVTSHNIIYHAIDEIKELMRKTLDKLEEEHDLGKAKIIALFKSSQLGTISGCLVTEGVIKRNSHIRIVRDGEKIYTGKLSSIKRVNEEVKEVNKGLECGMLFDKFSDVQKDDIIEAYEIKYLEQEL